MPSFSSWAMIAVGTSVDELALKLAGCEGMTIGDELCVEAVPTELESHEQVLVPAEVAS